MALVHPARQRQGRRHHHRPQRRHGAHRGALRTVRTMSATSSTTARRRPASATA
jgi:hypothetical protein